MPESAPEGGAARAGSSSLARREPPATGELPDQPVVTGWDIVVSGSALAASHPDSSLLAHAHHAIDRLGGSLAAGLAELEAERRRLAAECAAHEAESRRFAVSRREAQETRPVGEEGERHAAAEAALQATAAKEAEAEACLQAATDS